MDARTSEVRPGRGYSLVEENPDQIKRDIDRTRAHLDETVSAISARLSPRRMVDEFVDMFTGGERRTGREPRTREVIGAVRDNPVPAALIGAGIVWFLFDRMRGGQETGRQMGRHDGRDWLAPGATYEPSPPGEMRDRGEHGKLREKAGEAMESGRERLEQAGRTVKHWAEDAGESISDTAREAGRRISHAIGGVREHMHISGEGPGLRERAEDVRHRAQDTVRNVRDTVGEYPLIIGATALACGLVAGLAAPPTRTEREILGPVRDDLIDQTRRAARDLGPQVREAAQEVAQRTGQAIAGETSKEAFDEGATLMERAARVASAGIHAAGEASREKLHEGEPRVTREPGKQGPPSPQRGREPPGRGGQI
jgi:gas vesicle protein